MKKRYSRETDLSKHKPLPWKKRGYHAMLRGGIPEDARFVREMDMRPMGTTRRMNRQNWAKKERDTY